MFAFSARIQDTVIRLIGILPASFLVSFGNFRVLAFATWIQDAVIGFVSVFGAVVTRLCDFAVFAFAAWVKNAVISFIRILSTIILCLRYLCMLTLPARVEDTIVGLV